MKPFQAASVCLAALLLSGPLAACATSPGGDGGSPVLDALWPGGRTTVELAELAARAPLAAGEDFRAVEVARDGATSHHVVSIRHEEVPHRHDHHDLLVVLLKGYGTMRLGDDVRAIGEHSVLYIPRGTLHTFANHSHEPAVAFAVYLPAFDGKDRVLLGP